MTAIIRRTIKTALTFILLTIGTFLFSGSLSAQTFDYSIIHSFGPPRLGVDPLSPVLPDNKGSLYGTNAGVETYGTGVIYEISTLGVERALHTTNGGSDGGQSISGLVSDPAGNLYGVTLGGGDLSCRAPYGCGTVFKLDSSHEYSVLHTFTQNEGSGASSGLTLDSLGNLYGSLSYGTSGFGAIYKLDALGNLTVLHSFVGGKGGQYPNGLIIDKLGNLYGTTVAGGTYNYGTVFKMDPAGQISIIYNFAGGSDGVYPQGTLARDSAGNVYGATDQGGDSSCHCGTLFRLNLQSRTKTALHSFTGADGVAPNGGLILDSAGNLYGMTSGGGSYEFGVVFMLDANGVFSVLHEFAGVPDGDDPYENLSIDRAGNLYGTTEYGGANNVGTVFKLTRQ